LCILLYIVLGFSFIHSKEKRSFPPERPRVKQSKLTVVYFPSFGVTAKSPLPLYDNFYINGEYINVFPRNANLNFYYWVQYFIRDSIAYPDKAEELSISDLFSREQSIIGGKVNGAFLRFFQINLQSEYIKSRSVAAGNAYADFNYQKIAISADMSYDSRYSFVENYYRGKIFKFPQEGFLLKAGVGYNVLFPDTVTGHVTFLQASFYSQLLIQLHKYWILSGYIKADALSKKDINGAHKITSTVIGAYDIPGDYTASGSVELRFLSGKGLYYDSPPFWYIASFMFKFSPGFILGYNPGLAGVYTGKMLSVHSFYLSPIVAIRINGELQSVLRLDFSITTSSSYSYILAVNYSTHIDTISIPLARKHKK
jgi:hypothetical protein